MVPQQKAFSLYFLSPIYSISVQNLHEVANSPFPISRCQLSKTGKLSREQVVASLSNSSSTNIAELKLKQGKKSKQWSFLINTMPTPMIFSNCASPLQALLDEHLPVPSVHAGVSTLMGLKAVELVEKQGFAQRLPFIYSSIFQIMFFFP